MAFPAPLTATTRFKTWREGFNQLIDETKTYDARITQNLDDLDIIEAWQAALTLHDDSVDSIFGMGDGSFANLTGTADDLVGLGANVFAAATVALNSVALGGGSLSSVVDGINNVGLGTNTGAALVDGSNNLLGGVEAGKLITGSNNILLGFQAGDTLTASSYQFRLGTGTGNHLLSGNLQGGAHELTVHGLFKTDDQIILNESVTGAPTANALLTVERGSSSNVQIRWNETADKWEFTNNGTVWEDLGGLDHAGISITGQNSISGGGTIESSRTLALVGDAASPGNNKYYGTDGAGAKGWQSSYVPVANENIDHTTVSMTANKSIVGGGTIAANRTFELDGDVDVPVALNYYGTNDAGVKGWHSLATGVDSGIISFGLRDGDTTVASMIDSSVTQFVEGAGISINFTGTPVGDAADPFQLEFIVDHDAASNFVANEHINHANVSISTTNSLTGGGTIAANRTLSLVGDTASPGNWKVYGTNGTGTKGWQTPPANENIDHTTVSISTAKSLTGGGTIDATRTIELVNDLATPGNNYYYGTNASGVKGWLSSAASGMNSWNAVDGDGTTVNMVDGEYIEFKEGNGINANFGIGDGSLATPFDLTLSLKALTANWDAGGFEIRSATFESDVATGTAPFVVASTTLVTNLNADLLDGNHASAFATATHNHAAGDITTGTLASARLPDLAVGDFGASAYLIAADGWVSSDTQFVTSAAMGARFATIASLATVATSGAYADLTGQPTIPAEYTDWNLWVNGTKQKDVTSANDVKFAAGSNVTLGYAADVITISATDTNTIYTHPTHPGDDFSIDTGLLSGASVISDIDINVTTDTLGHVTDANATVATRTLTLANLGYTGDTDANNYTHPTGNGNNHIPINGSSGQYLKYSAAGTAVWDTITATEVGAMASFTVLEGNGTESTTMTNGETLHIEQGTGIQVEMTSTTGGAQLTITNTVSNTWRGIDDTPVNGQTGESISSNWAYDHLNTNPDIHIDWTVDQGATNIHAANYTDTTYSAGAGLVLTTTTFSVDQTLSLTSLTCTGDVTGNTGSDINLKNNVTPIIGALDKVCNLTGNSFFFNNPADAPFVGLNYGLIAQEVAAVMPELVSTNGLGYQQIRNGGFEVEALLVEAIKELRQEVKDLRKELGIV